MILTNAKIVLHDSIFEGSLELSGSTIAKISKYSGQGIDCKGLYVGPGFIDAHSHGGDNRWFFDDPEAAANFHLRHGTTSILASLWRNAGKDGFANSVRRIVRVIDSGNAPNLVGIHMEGPYIDGEYGSEGGGSYPIDRDEYSAIIKAGSGYIKQWTFDPLQLGAYEFAEVCYSNNIKLGICYSKAAPEDIERYKRYGLCIGNHIMCGSGKPNTKFEGTIEAGSDEYVLANNHMFAELICDSIGAHVRHENIVITYKCKGADGIMLITDYCADGETNGSDINVINAELYGSKLTMNVACRNFKSYTGAAMPEIFIAASTTAAKALGLTNVGRVEEGFAADLVICDEDFDIFGVIKNGEFIVNEL